MLKTRPRSLKQGRHPHRRPRTAPAGAARRIARPPTPPARSQPSSLGRRRSRYWRSPPRLPGGSQVSHCSVRSLRETEERVRREPAGPVGAAVDGDGGERLVSGHTGQASWERWGREDCHGPKNTCSVQPSLSQRITFSQKPRSGQC